MKENSPLTRSRLAGIDLPAAVTGLRSLIYVQEWQEAIHLHAYKHIHYRVCHCRGSHKDRQTHTAMNGPQPGWGWTFLTFCGMESCLRKETLPEVGDAEIASSFSA